MKCLKAIRETKSSKVGDIVRVSNNDADEKVSTGYWMYIPKKEWKEYTRKPVETSKETTKTLEVKQKKEVKSKKEKKDKKSLAK